MRIEFVRRKEKMHLQTRKREERRITFATRAESFLEIGAPVAVPRVLLQAQPRHLGHPGLGRHSELHISRLHVVRGHVDHVPSLTLHRHQIPDRVRPRNYS